MRALLLLAALAGPGGQDGAHAAVTHEVAAGFNTFTPPRVRALTGDRVVWANDSARAHTVTGDGFDSGRLGPGARFERRFDAAGTFPYHCSLHVGMTGEVEVAPLLLETPAAAAAPGRPYPLRGRAALPAGSDVTVVGDAGPLARATVDGEGRWAATIVPRTSTTLRAVAGDRQSAPATLAVLDRAVRTRRAGRALAVTVTPAAPGQTVVLQLRLPLRFGWWPVQRARLDARSTARFRLPRRRVPSRVVLTLRDGATVLAASAAELGGHEVDGHQHEHR